MTEATPWGGRFREGPADALLRFSESTAQDAALFEDDVQGSIAHARMLAARGLISPDDARAIVQGLEGLLADWRAGRIQLDPRLEDVHMNVERLLEQRVGEPARRLHT
ncbi:MAG TPA: lyase family protein, partial [Bacillota bacterium]